MKKAIQIIAIVLACFLGATLIAAVIGRGVTGKWNPVEWGQTSSTDKEVGGGKDGIDGKDGETPYIGENGNWFIGEVDTGVKAEGKDGKDGETPYIGSDGNWHIGSTNTGVAATRVVEPVNPELITEFTELTFSQANGDVYYDAGCWFLSKQFGFDIYGPYGEVSAYNSNVSATRKKLYRNTSCFGLKMETQTEIVFELGVPMTLYLWLDKVEQGAHSTSSALPLDIGISIDRDSCFADKVSDDEIGYTLSLRLGKGVHTIRKVDTCVLSYLSLTP